MRKGGIFRRALALILCAALFGALALPGAAEETQGDGGGLLDGQALTGLVEDFLNERGIPSERVSVGFWFPETGEEWFYRPDVWYYPASVYKVPLMMALAERVSTDIVDPEEVIAGLPLPKLFSYILTYSNNDYAHEVRKYLGGDEAWRQEVKEYAGLPDDYYDPDYMDYCYFSPRYITRVMETLYKDPDRFPMVIDCLLAADRTHYFQQPPDMYDIEIAQKYGSYIDMQGDNWNHATGIIYTPHPFVLTVMTKNVSNYEYVLGQLALRFTNYVLSLEDRIAPFVEEQAVQEAERQAAEEAEIQAQAQAQAEQAEAQRQEAERQAQAQRRMEERAQQDRAARQMIWSLAAVLAALLVIGVLIPVLIRRQRKKKRYEAYRRRFKEELRQEMENERETR